MSITSSATTHEPAFCCTRHTEDVARQLTWQGIADTVDAGLVTALTVTGRFPRVRGFGMAGLAAVSAAAEYAGAWRLRRLPAS